MGGWKEQPPGMGREAHHKGAGGNIERKRKLAVLRICKYCGKTYDGEPGTTCCKACAGIVKRSVMRERTCKQCGQTFSGGPRAWYCPTCRMERKKEADRRAKAQKHKRALGSTDKCEICGKEYTVMSSRQRYCKDCAADAVKMVDREQGKEYYHATKDVDGRRKQRQDGTAPIKCVICGKPFIPVSPAKTCSATCAAELHKRSVSFWEKSHRSERNDYKREKRKET